MVEGVRTSTRKYFNNGLFILRSLIQFLPIQTRMAVEDAAKLQYLHHTCLLRSFTCYFHTWINMHPHQHSHIHPPNDPRMHFKRTQTHSVWTYSCGQRHTPLPFAMISRTLSQHLLDLWWLYGLRYYCLPSSLLPLFLLMVSSAGLSLMHHGVINHTTGSSSAFKVSAGLQHEAKTICPFL